MGSRKKPAPPPPVNIPKPLLREVPTEMTQSAYNPEAYYPEAADALQRISAMEGSAMKEFNANIPNIVAENKAKMAAWQQEVNAAERRRQQIIASQGRGKKSGVLPAIGGTILAGPIGGYAAYKTSRSL
jgi:hypothetical protein